jgi:hypothetical protein
MATSKLDFIDRSFNETTPFTRQMPQTQKGGFAGRPSF